MSRSPSRDRNQARTGRGFAGASGGGGGGGGHTGLTLLHAYATTSGVNEATPRVITLETPSAAGRTIFAYGPSSVGWSIASPWTLVTNGSASTVYQVYKLAAADNAGITTVTVTFSGTAYPFSCIIFEDDVDTNVTLKTYISSAAPSSPWTATFNVPYTADRRAVHMWNAQKYQIEVAGDITAYTHSAIEIGDTGRSGFLASNSQSWYSNRSWGAYVDGLTGSVNVQATLTGSDASHGWTGVLEYKVGPPV